MTTIMQKEEKKEPQKKRGRIEDYLTGPRKKSKNYILFALNPQFDPELASILIAWVRSKYLNFSVAIPRNTKELTQQVARSISLIIIDDEFADSDFVIKIVRAFKEKRQKGPIPVLFLTRNPKELLKRYNRELQHYQETDDYIVYPKLSHKHIFSRIRIGIEEQNRRRSRRYQISQTVQYSLLGHEKWLEASLIDMSLHGATLKAASDQIFQPGDQVKLNITLSDHLPREQGDFLKLSAVVRRVFISGNIVGLSFEYVTKSQYVFLSRYLTHLINRQMAKKAGSIKAKLALRNPYSQ